MIAVMFLMGAAALACGGGEETKPAEPPKEEPKPAEPPKEEPKPAEPVAAEPAAAGPEGGAVSTEPMGDGKAKAKAKAKAGH
jgi:hypothetical protein